MLHEQMGAHIIEGVGIQAGCENFGQPLVQFEIEDGEAQRLRRADLGGVAREPGAVGGSGTGEQPDGRALHSHVFKAAGIRPTSLSRWRKGNLTGEGEKLIRLAAEGALEPFARFRRESARRCVVNFVRVLMHGLAEETDLLSITSAPLADEKMKPK